MFFESDKWVAFVLCAVSRRLVLVKAVVLLTVCFASTRGLRRPASRIAVA